MTAGDGLLVAAGVLLAGLPWTTSRSGGVRHPGGTRAGAAGPRQDGGAPGSCRRPRRPWRRARVEAFDAAALLDLLEAAVASGAAVPRALSVVGGAVGGIEGAALVQAAGALELGGGWTAAWAGVPVGVLDVARALEDSWEHGTAPGPALRARSRRLRAERRSRARAVAGSLGVRLVLPLGLCFLPAFVLLGLVPVVLGIARGLL